MRKKILVVDDDELSRGLLRQIFEDEYDVIAVKDGRQAILEIGRHMHELAVILLDLIMPVLNGYQVLQVLNAEKVTDRIPVVLITSQTDAKTEVSAYALGASSVITKPYVPEMVKCSVNNIIALRKSAAGMEEIIRNQNRQISLQQQQLETYSDRLLEALSNIVEFRDLESGEHIKRVKGFTRIIAQTYMQIYPEAELTKNKINIIARASVTHDIGKIAIPDKILLKPGRLTEEEREIMKTHTVKGCEILDMLTEMQNTELLSTSYEICRYHHERDDGGGYPDGLRGDEIPISAQLVSIADVYDALVSERCYKEPYAKDRAYDMIMEGKCGIFSPKLLKCLEYSRNAMEAFADSHQ